MEFLSRTIARSSALAAPDQKRSAFPFDIPRHSPLHRFLLRLEVARFFPAPRPPGTPVPHADPMIALRSP